VPEPSDDQQQLIAELAIFSALGTAHIAVDLARPGQLDWATLDRLNVQLERAAGRLSPVNAGVVEQLQELLATASSDRRRSAAPSAG
jgi:hypothetical protein